MLDTIPKPLQEMAYMLTRTQIEMPVDTEDYANSIPLGARAGFIEYCAENGYTGMLFARSCALLGWNDLTEWTRKWFRSRDIVLLPDRDIRIHLRHRENVGRFGEAGCHEVA